MSLKSFIQRGKRGYADQDLWSLDTYLADWLPIAIRDLSRISHGYPTNLTEKKWNDILEKMARGFEAHNKQFDLEEDMEFKKLKKIEKEGIKLFAKYFDSLWD